MSHNTPFLDSALEDAVIQAATNEYCYADRTIELEASRRVYQISQSRLTLRSPFFRGLLSLPQTDESIDKTPPMHVDVRDSEWKAYLWYLHADPRASDAFAASTDSAEKCARYLGIAVVAHRYDATETAIWAIWRALAMLKQQRRAFQVDTEVARLLISVASRWHGESAVTSDCRDLVCDALHPSRDGELARDPIAALEIAREDTFVLAHVYFYMLRKGHHCKWRDDPRVKPVDRQRLYRGAYSLGFPPSWCAPGDRSSSCPVAAARVPAGGLVPLRGILAAYVGAVLAAPTSVAVAVFLVAHAFLQRALRGSPPEANGQAIAAAPPHIAWCPRLDSKIPHPREELWAYFADQDP